MHDPSTSPSPLPTPNRLPSPSPPPGPPSPSPPLQGSTSPSSRPPRPSSSRLVEAAFASDEAHGLVGHRVVSGTGEELGVVTGILLSPEGRPRKLVFVESGDAEARFVPLRFVRAIGEGVVRLAGPREGYHITRVRAGAVSRVMRDPEDEDDALGWS